jgi:dipeptidyl aminopeptidase/acylaminoacyl peptidase
VLHGELDYRVPVSQGFQYFNTLRARGVESRLVYFPDENHWVLKPQNSRLWFSEFFWWVGRFVKGVGVVSRKESLVKQVAIRAFF